MTDPITDMLNRIRNSQAVLKETVAIPYSNLKYQVAEIIKNQGLFTGIEKKGRKEKRTIEIVLKYEKDENVAGKKKPIIQGLKRVSMPGKRIYRGYKEIKAVKGGYGMAILSTPAGLMIDKEAKKKKLGGEILFEIW